MKFRFFFPILLLLSASIAPLSSSVQADEFELLDGDRVVFLGNTLIEREQKYGYWETMLTARWPERDIKFRNLGWSGDTVWADSRGIFDSPEKGYQRMLEHVGRIKPTVMFIGYGNVEAFSGKEGLPAFIKQYNKLLDDLTKVSAKGVRFVVLSPVFLGTSSDFPEAAAYRANCRLYAKELEELSSLRHSTYVDLLSDLLEIQNLPRWLVEGYGFTVGDLSFDGMHLHEAGYFFASFRIVQELALPSLRYEVRFSPEGKVINAWGCEISQIVKTSNGLQFQSSVAQLSVLPLLLSVDDLSKGKYAVKCRDGGKQVETASILMHGCVLNKTGGNHQQYGKLRQAIIEKNRLYFYHWRPQNITYLTGFRKHEQGQNAKETAEFEKLVAEKEALIAKLRKPRPHTYELVRVKEAGE